MGKYFFKSGCYNKEEGKGENCGQTGFAFPVTYENEKINLELLQNASLHPN